MNAVFRATECPQCMKCASRMRLGRKVATNGAVMFKYFCAGCLWRPAQWISHADVENLFANDVTAEDLPDRTYDDAQFEARLSERNAESDKRREAYHAYLASHAWTLKRNLVLERDGHTCQACLTAKATQVHHKSYFGVDALLGQFNEPLFNLESVCRSCHVQIHGGTLSDDEAV